MDNSQSKVTHCGEVKSWSDKVDAVQTHPLFLDCVLREVFNFLPDDDLANCRTVCRAWRSEASRLLSKRNYYSITSIEEMKNLLENLSRAPTLKVSRLRLENVDLNNPFFTKLARLATPSLFSLSMDTCLIESMEPIHNMIRSAPKLKELTLDTLKVRVVGGSGCFRHALFPITSPANPKVNLSFPNILRLSYMSYDTKHDAKATTLSAAIATFPNLEVLAANNLSIGPDHRIYNQLSLPKLRKLSVIMVPIAGLKDEHLRSLIALKLNLESLTLNNVGHDIDSSLLRQFIESQASRLQTLTIHQLCQEEREEEYTIPILPLSLPNLQNLTIGKNFIRNLNHVFNEFPKLKRLGFEFTCPESWSKIFPNKVGIHPTLYSLELNHMNEKNFGKLSVSLVNITQLTLNNCYDELLFMIYQHLPQLKVLDCLEEEDQRLKMTAYGITGVRRENQPRTKPFIADLKHLRDISLTFAEAPSEKIIWEGILKCESIRSLLIVGQKLSRKAMKALFKAHNLNNLGILHAKLRRDRIIRTNNAKASIVYLADVSRVLLREENTSDSEPDLEFIKP